MSKQEWIDQRAEYLVAHEGTGTNTAAILAKATADQMERKIGDISAWPKPDYHAVHPLAFLNDPDETA